MLNIENANLKPLLEIIKAMNAMTNEESLQTAELTIEQGAPVERETWDAIKYFALHWRGEADVVYGKQAQKEWSRLVHLLREEVNKIEPPKSWFSRFFGS